MFITTARALKQIVIYEGKKYYINFGEVFSARGYLSISESTSEWKNKARDAIIIIKVKR